MGCDWKMRGKSFGNLNDPCINLRILVDMDLRFLPFENGLICIERQALPWKNVRCSWNDDHSSFKILVRKSPSQ
jgi:hypothetical protein